MRGTPCLDECRHLLALADGMARVFSAGSDANAGAKALATSWAIDGWRAEVEALTQASDLESLLGELKLEGLALKLRRLWLRQVYALSSSYMMSPPHAQHKRLPGSLRVGYPYDRWIKPVHIEQRLAAQTPAPEGWCGRNAVFASGMAAISTILQVYRATGTQIWPRPKGPLSLHWFGGYFEITKLLRLSCDAYFHGRKHASQSGLCKAVELGVTDFILIEPVAADIDLDVFDLEAFVRAWKLRRQKRPCVILVDTSLTGPSFRVEDLCRSLGPYPPALVIEVRSGVKLDQEGLELSNVGLVRLLAPDAPDQADRLERFEHNLRVARTTVGAALSEDEYATLSAPFFLDRDAFERHSAVVFENNRAFARGLQKTLAQGSGLITQVIHPCLGVNRDKPWANAPYVNLRYASDDDSARAFLRAVLEFEAQTRRLCLLSGSSFGFRGHRFEMGFVRGLKHSTLRVAMGARQGPSRDGVIQLFQDLARYPDFPALRKAYPQIAKNAPDDRVEEEG